MPDTLCSTCKHIKLAHTGNKGQVEVGHGMAIHLDQGWCLQCPNETKCFQFKEN